MAKAKAQAAPAPAPFQITLNEFCARRSKTDNRVELISGFHHSEASASRLKDTEDAYAARFEQFINAPA